MSSSTKSSSRSLQDEEFGLIPYRRIPRATHVRIRVAPDGTLRASLPLFASLSSLRRLIENSRDELRRITAQSADSLYQDGQVIGHSHSLRLIRNSGSTLRGSINGQIITVTYPADTEAHSPQVQSTIRSYVSRALRLESKAYLPRRLSYLAQTGGFTYQRVRFAHQSGRWGSCSTRGTISLNIALMNLPFELIDYVLIHELAHTKQMNHSQDFWSLVEAYYPDFKTARKLLKSHNPNI